MLVLFQEKQRITGIEDSIVNTVRMGNYIRVALSQVKEVKIMHFVDMQKKSLEYGNAKILLKARRTFV
jgi:hypothetical protein